MGADNPTQITPAPVASVSSPPVAASAPPLSEGQIITSTVEETVSAPSPKKPRSKLVILMFALVFVLFIFAGGAAFAYGVAYEKIDIGNKNLQKTVSGVVMGLPFTPKTPEYVLFKAYEAQKTVKSFSYESVLSASSKNLGFGVNDIIIKGQADFNDAQNPKLSANYTLGNVFSGDLMLIDKKLYLKVNVFSLDTLEAKGLTQDMLSPYFSKWIVFDSKENGSLANFIPDYSASGAEGNIPKMLNSLYDSGLLKRFELAQESLDGLPVYKLVLNIDSELLARLDEIAGSEASMAQLPATEDPMRLEIYIARKDYLLQKINLATTYEAADLIGIINGKYDLLLSVKFSDQNLPASINAPSESVSIDKLVNDFSVAILGNNAVSQFVAARDFERKSHLYEITNAVYQYAAENDGNMPNNFPEDQTCIGKSSACIDLSVLVPEYIDEIPYDPTTGDAENTGYGAYIDPGIGRLVVTAVSEENGQLITIMR